MKFCLFTAGRARPPGTPPAEFIFFAHEPGDLNEPGRRFTLTSADIALLNPNTRSCPIFRSQRDGELTKAIYQRVPVLIRETPPEENPWGISFRQGHFNMTSDSHLFHAREQLEGDGWRLVGNVFERNDERCLPVYEAKLFHQFNHRPSTFDGMPAADRFKMKAATITVSSDQLADPLFPMIPRFWVAETDLKGACGDASGSRWLVVFRGMTNVMTNSRNAVFTAIPGVAAGNSAPICLLKRVELGFALVACANSFAFDYATRQKLAGGDLNFFIVQQLPMLPPERYAEPCRWAAGTLRDWLLPRVLELTYTAWDLEGFAQDCLAEASSEWPTANRDDGFAGY